MNIKNLNNTTIYDFLSTLGYTPVKKSGSTLWYLSPLRAEHNASFKVDIEKNTWYDFGTGIGGGMSKLLKEFFHSENVPNVDNIIPLKIEDVPSVDKAVFSIVSTSPGLKGNLLHYIRSRGISNIDLINKFCQTVTFHNSTRNKDYYAIGFQNVSGGFEIRNQYFKGAIPPKDITLVQQGNRACAVFEGFMDFLSCLCIGNQQFGTDNCDYLVLNSTANTAKSIPALQRYDMVYSFMDNDKTGKDAFSFLARSLNRITDMSVLYAPSKDLNEFLCTTAMQK